MDFGTICNNLELGLKYRDAADVYKDVQLIWDNCSKYNKKGGYILELMKRAKSNFIKHWNATGLLRHPEEADADNGMSVPGLFLSNSLFCSDVAQRDLHH